MKDEELLNKRLKLEEEYHDLLDRDHNRFSVADLQDFIAYLNSEGRVEDQTKLFPHKYLYDVLTDGFNLFDIMNFLDWKRSGE